jgi:enoyl-CoA hydratase/carnithine racemase
LFSAGTAHAVAIAPDGKIVVAGGAQSFSQAMIVRFTASGAVDQTFGALGTVADHLRTFPPGTLGAQSVANDVVRKKLAPENEAYSRLDDFPKPTIAALNGLAYGGGLELAVCCDILIAGADVRLALPEVKLGVLPGSGGTVRVPRRIGEGRAKELMFTGDPIDAETAQRWGLVNRVVPAGQALAAALELGRTLAERPNRALQLIKEATDLAQDMPEDEAIRRTLALSEAVFRTEDAQEGVRAFFAKEPPRWRHR